MIHDWSIGIQKIVFILTVEELGEGDGEGILSQEEDVDQAA